MQNRLGVGRSQKFRGYAGAATSLDEGAYG